MSTSPFLIITNENFGYDKNGNKIYEDQNGDIRKYTYDGLNRLTGAEIGNVRTEYEFDNFNNISREYEIIGAKIEKKSYYYDNANRLLLEDGQRTVQYEYDNSGNLIKKITGIGSTAETAHYRYDGYNRLTEFIDDYSTAEYEYNINGLRESKTVNGTKTRYIYNGADIVGEIFDDNIYTYYRGTELIGYTNNKGDRYYYRQNSHGDVTALLTVDGQEKKAYSYSAYGKEIPFSLAPMGSQTVVQLWRAETEQIHNPFRYCGEYYDQETGFIYLRNRYYDNSTGRFITEDPIKDGLNWYVYCGNNPENYVDPSGLDDVGLRDWVESRGGTVTPNQYNFLGIKYGLKSITVSLNGITKTYTSSDYHISKTEDEIQKFGKDRSIIDDSVLIKDFNLEQSLTSDEKSNSNNKTLSEEEKLMICTVYGEAAGCSEVGWQAIANVMMNRIGVREWSRYKNVSEIIKNSGFDAYTSKNIPYKQAEQYLLNRDGSNEDIERCIDIVTKVYNGDLPDNTDGAVLYYSPKAQQALYGYQPNWNFSVLTEVTIKGGENDDLKFYKYK